MAFRHKHRQTAMIKRILEGRVIKSDHTSLEYAGLRMLIKGS